MNKGNPIYIMIGVGLCIYGTHAQTTTNDKQTNKQHTANMTVEIQNFFLSIGSFDNHNSQNKNNIKKNIQIGLDNKQTNEFLHLSFVFYFFFGYQFPIDWAYGYFACLLLS